MREYETLYILKPELSDNEIGQLNDRLKGVLEREGAQFLKCDIWGKKRLAFEVAKNPKGVFIQMCYLSSPAIISEFERNLRMIEPVVRYQTVRVADNVDVEKRLAEQAAEDRATAEAKAKAAAEAKEREAAEAKARAEVEAASALKAASAEEEEDAEIDEDEADVDDEADNETEED